MKRTTGILLSLALALTVSLLSPASFASQNKAEKLGKQQILTLISTAKTAADHQRLANYYEAKAQDYLAQSKEHEDAAAAYRQNAVTASSKFASGTVNHCDYFAQSFKEDALKMQELSKMHQQMASDAGGR